MKAKILLEDGTILEGESFGADKTVFGEIVFNTGMTGYQEILTDPSYAGQVVVMTYPLIGSYGINEEDIESCKIQVNGFVVKEFVDTESNWKSTKNLSEYLIEHNIMGISGLDTRMLTKKIRTQGTMNCVMTTGEITEELIGQLKSYSFPKNIVTEVSRKDFSILSGNNRKIGLIDFGVKTGIVKYLAELCCEIHLFPWDVPAETILDSGLDAVLLSNGPGDPKDVTKAIETTKKLIGKIPLFGICLGHQILALALGGDTYKLKFGHRGSNHPVQDLRTNRVVITAQNHGYAVHADSLPENCQVTHININDKTVEGFCCPDLKINTVQFHPEAGPGPLDANYIFGDWVNLLGKEYQNA
ncbi:MAG: carbamoyl phosphate synthase small subunit [Candidatus Melainabacteria bacterium RIFOXYA12_FULL_32_12]|nr:MAG: carbamoyl phosphate synthase small subunit [Candidatus Melainabacteria bacterium RIFOXYA2_FULL_32_9]OGI29885.1 MAG: carbamoyl phosphate synthase small subunit [Candidatus Melainabacteria bacterium RIFOXYA12_FULL_32_12]